MAGADDGVDAGATAPAGGRASVTASTAGARWQEQATINNGNIQHSLRIVLSPRGQRAV